MSFTAAGLIASDEQVKNLDHAHYGKVASDESIARFKAAAEAKQWPVHIVNSNEEALAAIVSAVPEGATIYSTGSMSLEAIGFTNYAKEHAAKWDNIKAKIFAEQDQSKVGALYAQGTTAQYVITTPVAVTENAELLTADLTNTRVGPTVGGGKLVVLVGGQKIVKDMQAAHERLRNYVLPLESARARVVYKVPGSAANHVAELNGPNPFGAPGRITFVVIKQELGF